MGKFLTLHISLQRPKRWEFAFGLTNIQNFYTYICIYICIYNIYSQICLCGCIIGEYRYILAVQCFLGLAVLAQDDLVTAVLVLAGHEAG